MSYWTFSNLSWLVSITHPTGRFYFETLLLGLKRANFQWNFKCGYPVICSALTSCRKVQIFWLPYAKLYQGVTFVEWYLYYWRPLKITWWDHKSIKRNCLKPPLSGKCNARLNLLHWKTCIKCGKGLHLGAEKYSKVSSRAKSTAISNEMITFTIKLYGINSKSPCFL